jgi:hypothetical protein
LRLRGRVSQEFDAIAFTDFVFFIVGTKLGRFDHDFPLFKLRFWLSTATTRIFHLHFVADDGANFSL